MSEPHSDFVDELTVHFAGLEITITARRTAAEPASSATHGFEIVEPGEAATGLGAESQVTPELEERALQADSIQALNSLPLPFLDHLLPRFRASHTTWTPKTRLARAFRAGVASRRRLDGIFCEVSVPSVPFRNCFYVCLRAPGGEPPFWTNDYQIYFSKVRGPVGFHRDSISHAFASHCEVQAFLVGARKQWPRKL